MEKRQKKILLLSIFGGGAILIVVGYLAFLTWILVKAFPKTNIKDMASHFITLVECQSNSSSQGADPNCTKAFTHAIALNNHQTKSIDNPEYDLCVYGQEVILEALSASKSYGEDFLNNKISGYCEYVTSSGSEQTAILAQDNYRELNKIKNELASQEILNYRYSFFKKKNYPLELQALDIYRQLAQQDQSCAELEPAMVDLDHRGSNFILGSLAICKLKTCAENNESSCPEAIKLAHRMKTQGDVAAEYIYMHDSALEAKENPKAIKYAQQALLNGYTDLASEYPIIEDDFYKIKFNADSLTFNAARLATASKIYAPALNCLAASLVKDPDFETFIKAPKSQPTSVWVDKITTWADEDSDLLLRVACEVLTDVESKKRIHEYYVNDGNKDDSLFDFCTVIKDPLFADVCKN